MTTEAATTLNGDDAASVVAITPSRGRGKRMAIASAPAAAQAGPTRIGTIIGDPVLALIERVACDPAADIDKLERILSMRTRMEAESRERAFNELMAEAQKRMEPINADARNPETKSKYASLAKVDRAIRPIYTELGFALSFNTSPDAPPEHVRMLLDVSAAGHTKRYQVDMPTDGKGPKGGNVMSRTHAVGSGMSYGQRYLLKLAFNLAIDSSADDDGNAVGKATGGMITAEQVERIKTLAAAVKADLRRFCEFFGIASIEAIPAVHFDKAVAALAAKGSKSLAGGVTAATQPPTNAQRALGARSNGRA